MPLAFISATLLASCYYDNVEELYGANNCDVSNVDYKTVIKPIITQNCATSGCHVPGTGRKDLTTDQGIADIVNDGRLNSMVIVQRTMPPSQPLSSCNIASLRQWLNTGASVN
ncbi:MAG: hypothetical protein U5K79_15850 [Cyclobacteriaceae bacterium]|nr:hypothetical protein [Cyclobacteriaceae bacterium]